MLRDSWTKKLQRMIQDIEAGIMPVPVKELYVCGAYARGEIDPKELNVAVIHDEPSEEQLQQYQRIGSSHSVIAALSAGIRGFESHFYKVLRRPNERINIFRGSSLKQAYKPRNKEEEGLLLIWTPDDRDWLEKIASIPIADGLR